jgi:hypothetical protein
VTRFRNTLGLPGRLATRLQPNNPADDRKAIAASMRLVIGLLAVSARRQEHLRYLADDPLFARLCGLSRIPSDRTVVNWLERFSQASLRALIRLNSELLYEQIQQLDLPRLTIDLDGTVICTGSKVA